MGRCARYAKSARSSASMPRSDIQARDVIVEKHPTVDDLEIGDRVAYGGEGTGHAETIVTGRNLVARVPDSVPFEDACFATLGSIALNAVRIANIGLGDTRRGHRARTGRTTRRATRQAAGWGRDRYRSEGRNGRRWRRTWAPRMQFPERSQCAKRSLAITDGRGADCVIVAAAAKSSRAVSRGARNVPRSRPHRRGGRGGDEFPLERHVSQGNSALHVARLRSGEL